METDMPVHTLRHCAALFILTVTGTAAVHGQSVVEHGIITTNSANAAAKLGTPVGNMGLPASAPSPSTGAAPGLTSLPVGNTEVATKMNLQFFQDHAGPDAAQVTVHTVPDHAQVWIDGKFVGQTPLDLKLAPGHHQLLVRAPNMQESTREFDLTAKQTQSIDLPLKSSYQSQVVIQWPSQK
jgi:hypothetical protein